MNQLPPISMQVLDKAMHSIIEINSWYELMVISKSLSWISSNNSRLHMFLSSWIHINRRTSCLISIIDKWLINLSTPIVIMYRVIIPLKLSRSKSNSTRYVCWMNSCSSRINNWSSNSNNVRINCILISSNLN